MEQRVIAAKEAVQQRNMIKLVSQENCQPLQL